MAGETVVAGSYIAAVMELAGYRVQSEILTQFQDFFQEAGAFIYVLAAVGAVVSYVTMGSFRAVRYLLIGPALFWLLVTPRTHFDGAQWQVGAGDPRALHNQRGAAASQADIDRTVNDVFGRSVGGVDVAYGFALWVKVINELTRQMSALILDGQEDTYYSTFLHRGQALDAFINVRPRNAYLIHAIDNALLTNGCTQWVGNSLALGMPQISLDAIRAMEGSSPSAAAISRARRNHYLNKVTTYGEQHNSSMNAQARAQLGLNPNQTTNIPCNEAWRRVAEQVDLASNFEVKRIIDLAAFESPNRGIACGHVLKKITGEEVREDCEEELKNAVSIMIIKNVLTDRQALAKFVALLMNDANTPGQGRGPTGLAQIPLGTMNMFGNNPIVAAEHFDP